MTVNESELVDTPPGVVASMGPLEAPVGAVAVICVSESTENLDSTPLKVTAVAPVRPLPAMLTETPGQAELGVNDEIAGTGGGPGCDIGSGVAVAPLLGAVPRPKKRYRPASRP